MASVILALCAALVSVDAPRASASASSFSNLFLRRDVTPGCFSSRFFAAALNGFFLPSFSASQASSFASLSLERRPELGELLSDELDGVS